MTWKGASFELINAEIDSRLSGDGWFEVKNGNYIGQFQIAFKRFQISRLPLALPLRGRSLGDVFSPLAPSLHFCDR